MAFILKDRVKESTFTTGTGAVSLEGSSETFDSFQSYMTNGDTTYYAIITSVSGTDEWEVGLGTWNTGNTITRTTVLSGSNGTSAVNFGAGKKDVFMTYPADKAVYTDASGNIDINGGTIDGTTIGATSATTGKFSTLQTTSNADIGGYIDLEVLSSHAAYKEGRIWYDSLHKTVNFYSDDQNVIHELGIEEHQRVFNDTGSTILKGKPLYFSGNYTGGSIDVPTVGLADATDVNAYNAQGLAASDISNGSYGYCIIAGQLDGFDTSGLNAGTNFFVGLTPGAVQNESPLYPNFPMCLGWVVNSDATDGTVLVNQQNHSVNSFRVRTSAHVGADLQVDGNLTVLGSTTSVSTSDVTAGAPFYRANEGDAIGEAGTTFSGTGLDDAFFAGHFTGTTSTTYYVKIDGVGTGTGGVDTFTWSTDNFVTSEATGVDITGNEQLIHSADNISVTFSSTTGHTLNDQWNGTASPINVDSGFFTNYNTGTSGVGYTHTGFYYDASEGKWVLLNEYDPVPAGAIDLADSSTVFGTIKAGLLEANVIGNVTGNVTGTATSAVTLATARNIGGVSFNGTADINLPGVNTAGNQNTTGNAATATALATARTVQLSGDVTGSATFDGSANINITAAVQDDSHAHVISNVDGLQTALDAKTNTSRQIISGDGLTGGGDFTANRTLAVGAGTGITVNANNVAIDTSYTGFDSRYVNVTGDTITGSVNIETTGGAALTLKDTNGSGTNAAIYIDFDDSAGNRVGYVGIGSGGTNDNWFFSEIGSPILASGNGTAPKYYKGSNATYYDIFHDGYHPNADKWTDARTLSLTGDVTGSVSWDGSGNASLSTDWRGGTANAIVNMNNFNINNVNHLTFNDPGPTEGIEWLGGNGWRIVESPDDLTTNSGGNLQFVQSSTRRMTLKTNGDLDIVGGNLLVDSNNGIVNSGDWTRNTTPYGYIEFGPANASWGHIYTDRPAFYFNKELYVNNMRVFNDAYHPNADYAADSDKVDGLHIHTGRNNEANKVVRTDGNGYIQAGWINTTSGTAGTIDRIYCSQDAYVRYLTPANFRSQVTDGYYQPAANELSWVDQATGTYGTIKVDDDRGVTWAGYAIRDDWVFMANGAAEAGIYNDTDNEWGIKMFQNARTALYYNGDEQFRTESSGVSTDGGMRVGAFGNPHNANGLEVSMSSDEKIVLSGSNNPYIRWQEGTTDRAYIQWSSSQDALLFRNQQTDNFDFMPDSSTGAINLRLRGSDNDTWGSLYAEDGSGQNLIGILDGDQNWGYRITNDTSHEWFINNVVEMSLSTSTLDMKGNTITEVEDIGLRDRIYHDGDTDTYIQFEANDIFRIVIAGSEVMEWGTDYARLNDNDTLRLGSGSDFRMWHDGSHNYFRNYHHSAGNMYWQGENTSGTNHGIMYLHCDTTRTYVRLFENSEERLRTTDTGITVYGDVNSTSDIRYKKNVETIDNAVDKVKALRGVTFDWDNEAFEATGEEVEKPSFTHRATGVIAQDVEKVLPEAVRENEDGFKNVSYGNMVGLLIEAIKEQQEQIDMLTHKIDKMENL
jgi:hypothetical protein